MKAKPSGRSNRRRPPSLDKRSLPAAGKRRAPPSGTEMHAGAAKLQKTSRRLKDTTPQGDGEVDSAPPTAEGILPETLGRPAIKKTVISGKGKALFPIVGIGASAGGLEAAIQLLRHLPKNTGMTFVLVQHLDPTHESALASLLSRATSMSVTEAKNNDILKPNHVYIIPPNKLMETTARRLKLSPRRLGQHVHSSIDYFLRSLAMAEGSSAIGVILSGNGSDGAVGLQAIKAAGGITFAQERSSAQYPGMPDSAIAARCVDFVLSPAKMAHELARIAGHPYMAPDQSAELARPLRANRNVFEDILAMLRQQTGVEFTHYKQPTLHRRIQRRMLLHKFTTERDYADYLRSHPAEIKELFNDVLIHVTGFFRDPAVFAALKKKGIVAALKKQSPDQPIRIWVPGCSSGEEVYSIAITFLEILEDRQAHQSIQIFATDINEKALEKARAGFYPACIHEDVSPERLRRFFTKTNNGYRINKNIRERCIFARQNVVVDPPFSNLDLISCRNVLIYLGQPLQRKIMPVFHYALKSSGLLLLGASETIGPFAELFQLVDAKAKIYAKKPGYNRTSLTFTPFQPANPIPTSEAKTTDPHSNVGDVQKQSDRILLTYYSPAAVIINHQMEVLQFRGHTGTFFEHAQGEASLSLLKMAREGLIMDLRATVNKAMKQNARVRHEGARVKQNGSFLDVAIEVVPIPVAMGKERHYLVVLTASAPPAPALENTSASGRKIKSRGGMDEAQVRRLREELASTQHSLQTIVEEKEATNEELRSANEEIMSSNEELQCTNEELETAKEELQSTNEELTTLNEELENRNTEIDAVNSDLYNVLSSVNIPILVLGRDLRIRRFTTIAEKTLSLIASDVGRPITDIALKIDVPHLSHLVTEVIDSLTTKDIEAQDQQGHWWSVRIRPYKTTDNRIDGAVIALIDIHAVKTSAAQVEKSRAFAEALIHTVRHPLLVLDDHLSVRHVNESFLQTFKVNSEETINRKIYDLGNGQWNIPQLRTLLEEILPQNSSLRDFVVEHDFPQIGHKKMLLNARRLYYKEEPTQLILLAMEANESSPARS